VRTRVLFVCTDNAVQSPAAEAILRALGEDRFEPHSAGVAPTSRVDPRVVAALRAHNFVPPTNGPKGLDGLQGGAFDYLVTLCDDAQAPTASLRARERLHWAFSLDDPSAPLAFPGLVVGLRKRIELFITVVKKARGWSQ
jgi:protein-tyrosine-phosphatase